MGEAGGDVELVVVLAREHGAHPVAEGGRARADVDRHVEDLAEDGADQLPLRVAELGVEAAQGAADGEGVVVLDEGLAGAPPSPYFRWW